MSTRRYQILGDIVTGAQLDKKLEGYMPVDDNAEIVEWVEVDKDNNLVVSMKDGRESKYKLSGSKDFANVEYDGSTGYLHFYDNNGNDVYDPVFIGGGTGTGQGTEVRLTNQNGTTALVGSYGSAITLMFTFTSLEDDLETGNGTCKIIVNGVTKHTTSIPQGLNAIDVAPYLAVGSNTVKVTCIDTYGISKSLTYEVTVIKLTVESTFNAAVTYNGDITFKYTPYGAVEKTVHFLVDGNNAGTVVTSLTGKQLTKTFTKMSHGVHRLEVYSTATVNDTEIKSPSLLYDIICIEDGDRTPIIASVYETEELEQGAMVSIPYIVYDPTKLACDVTLTIYTLSSGSEVVYNTQTITVDRSQQRWNTRKYPVGTVYFRVAYGDIDKTHTVTVIESSIKVEPETNDLELQLTSEGRSNNETNPGEWKYGDISTTFSNFNWSSTGWVNDENGDACLRLNGDARAEISFQPFSSDLRTYGKTIELEFAIRDVHNRSAVPISCISGGIGFEVKPDTTYLKSEQSEVFCNYKDDERVKVTFVIESKDEYRLLSIYLNGVRSDAIQYPSTDNFQQTTPVNISIGSSDCGVDIYTIRSYTTALTSEGVANNFIADITDIVRKTEAFEDNDIYDEFGEVSYSKAREKNSVMVIVGDLPASKGDKKKVRIEYYDVEDSNLDYAEDDVTIDVQGTSSQFFVRKNWKLKHSEEHYIDFNQLPAKVICIKVDYAEATGTHNTQNANFVERLYSELTPAQKVDPKCRTTIYGKPILLFHQADSTSDPVFYGKSNFNYDKAAEYVFGFTDQFDVECWEFKNNTSDACNFLGPVPEIWVDDFEARYPEETTAIERFKEMHDWVVSTKDNLDKFKMEFEDHFDMHFSLIYYVYTFFALMVDQRAKNMFLTYWGETGKWQPWFYDNDTSFGINNEGQLVLDYYHEDTDQLEGANVYNGQNSVLWCNFRDAFPDKIKECYQNLRSNGVLNYDELIEQFISNGSDKWSESVYNEDADFKYISMLQTDGDASNLGQVRGTGEEHFRYFVGNRFPYCDGKWYAGEYPDDYVALRIYTPSTWAGVEPNADITVTPYSHMYAGVRYKANGTLYQKRVSANEVTTFEAPDETFNDTETAIYGASQLSSLGDLSPLYCGSINVAKATKLTELIIGSDAEGYSNPNLNDLSVGTNNLLKVLNVRNCPKLTDPLALSGCPNIEEIYAAGSGITGIELANSGYLKTIELPATITNLSLKNQLYIETLTLEGYDAIKTINIENCPTVASLDILGASTNVERVRLTNVNWSYDTAAEVLALADRNLAGIDENGANIDKMWIDGKCHIKTLTGAEYLEVKEAFPYMTITYDSLTAQLTFKSEDGSEDYGNQTIQNGGDGNYTGTTPTKATTAQYIYTFGGWSLTPGGEPDPDALKNVEADRIVYAAFNKELRSYTVRFYNGTTLLQTSTVQYGGDAVYSGSTPVNNSTGNPADFEFYGWKPAPTNIQGDTSCYAQFHDLREITDSWETIAANVTNGRATEKYAIGAFKMLDIGEVSLPYEFNQGSAVLYNGEIHILGSVVSEYRTSHYKWDGTKWVEVSTLPYEFYYGSAVVFNGEIHILGGSGSSSGKKKHYKWNGSEWVSVSTLPYMFRNGVAVVYNNEIHIMGSEESSYYTSHYKWNGSSWSEVGELPYSFYTASGFIYNNEIHVLGSYDSKYNTAHYKYDGSSWISVSTLSQKLSNGHALVIGTDIYMIQWDEFYKYDGTNWDTCPNVPANVYEGGSVVLDGNIYVMGSSVSGNERVFYSYAPETSTWSKVGITESIPMQIVAHNHDELADGIRKWESVSTCPADIRYRPVVNYNGELHYTLDTKHYKYDGSSWTEVSTTPYNTASNASMVSHNGLLHLIGGANNPTAHYTWDGSSWTEVGSLPREYYSGVVVIYNGEIHMIGGRNAANTILLKHHKWNETDGWTEVIDISKLGSAFATNFANTTVHDGKIFVYSSTRFFIYDGVSWTVLEGKNPRTGTASFLVSLHNNLYLMYKEQSYILNTNDYTWTEIDCALPVVSEGYSTYAIYNDEMHMFGGKNFGDWYKHFKWSGPSWVEYTTISLGYNNTACVLHNGEIHMIGGYSNPNGHYKIVGRDIENVGTIPKPFYSTHIPTSYNGKIHIFTNDSPSIHYMWDGVEWTIDSAYPSINGASARVIFNNELHLFNGTNHYKYNGTEWTSVGTRPRNGGVMFVYNGFIYLLGYFGGRNEFYYYDGNSWSGWGDIVTQTSTSSTWTKFDDGRVFIYNDDVYLYANNNILKWDKVSVWSPVNVIPSNNVHDYIVEINDHLICVSGATVYRYENPRATLTFLAGNLLSENIKINGNENSNAGGWNASYLRSYLNGDFISVLPSDLQTSISMVKKMSDSGAGNTVIVSTNDKAWIPSFDEVIGGSRSNVLNGQGEIYPVFTNNESRIRRYSNGDGATYILRTANMVALAQWMTVSHTGACWFGNANGTYAILFGFCI